LGGQETAEMMRGVLIRLRCGQEVAARSIR
jgi:hypothetical protein